MVRAMLTKARIGEATQFIGPETDEVAAGEPTVKMNTDQRLAFFSIKFCPDLVWRSLATCDLRKRRAGLCKKVSASSEMKVKEERLPRGYGN